MPYEVVKTGQDKGYVINTKSGKTYSDNPIPLVKAERQERLLRAVEHGFKPTGKSIENKKKDDPCWSGYEMFGMKTKDGRRVPNCVPKKE